MQRLKCNKGFVVLFMNCLSLWRQPEFHAFSGCWIISLYTVRKLAQFFFFYIRKINPICERCCEGDQTQYLLMVPETVDQAWNVSDNLHGSSRSWSCAFCAILRFSRSGVSYSWPPPRLQHARLPCPSLSPEVCSNPCPLSRWCHPTISSSVAPFSPFSFCAIGSSQL